MPVGKGSIKRVVDASSEVKEEKQNGQPAQKRKEEKKRAESLAVKEKTVKTKEAGKGKKKDNLHEKKFEVISHIHSDLPLHLL